jgi:hypothetical protein
VLQDLVGDLLPRKREAAQPQLMGVDSWRVMARFDRNCGAGWREPDGAGYAGTSHENGRRSRKTIRALDADTDKKRCDQDFELSLIKVEILCLLFTPLCVVVVAALPREVQFKEFWRPVRFWAGLSWDSGRAGLASF